MARLFNTSFRPVLFFFRFMQWASAVIVMGIASYFIKNFSTGEHIIYTEVIATTSVAFFLFPLATALTSRFTWHSLPLDLIYSYLWLTAFVFEAQDYNYLSCSATDPSDQTSCSLKYALEAFVALAFFFTVFSMILQNFIWSDARIEVNGGHHMEKNGMRPSGDMAA